MLAAITTLITLGYTAVSAGLAIIGGLTIGMGIAASLWAGVTTMGGLIALGGLVMPTLFASLGSFFSTAAELGEKIAARKEQKLQAKDIAWAAAKLTVFGFIATVSGAQFFAGSGFQTILGNTSVITIPRAADGFSSSLFKDNFQIAPRCLLAVRHLGAKPITVYEQDRPIEDMLMYYFDSIF